MNEPTVWNIESYETPEGIRPFERWFDGLRKGDVTTAALVGKRIGRLKYGHLGDYDNVGGGVLELRNFRGPGYRIYISRVGQIVYLLLLGGSKDGQKQDIETAKAYMAEFRGRRKGGAK